MAKELMNENIGSLTLVLSACSAVPQPATPPRVPRIITSYLKKIANIKSHVCPSDGVPAALCQQIAGQKMGLRVTNCFVKAPKLCRHFQ
jgi:hypothetical protein